MRDHPVGSAEALRAIAPDREGAYALGLWCADGYYWSSSVGLTNTDLRLARRFAKRLTRFLPRERLKWRVYYPAGGARPPHVPREAPCYPMRKLSRIAYQVYVNSRPLLRLYQSAASAIEYLQLEFVPAYFAGRFDGDGSIAADGRSDLRIAYGNRMEAEVDQHLLSKLHRYQSCVYRYRTAKTYVLYVSRWDAQRFVSDIAPYTTAKEKLRCPVETRSDGHRTG